MNTKVIFRQGHFSYNNVPKKLAPVVLAVFGDHPIQSCINCLNFDHENELCKKFQQRPPANVIALSCGAYYEDNDDIPF